jgi:hypothetical protein
MPDVATAFWLIIGIGFVLIAAYWLGSGVPTALTLAGLFPAQGIRDWPTGVQEADAPRFAVDHLDGLRPPAASHDGVAQQRFDDLGDPCPEIIELGSRRIDAPSR